MMTKTNQSFLTLTENDFYNDRNGADDFLHFLVNDLKDLYWFEKSLLKAVSRMKKNSHSKTFNELLEVYLIDGNLNIERLDQIFMFFGVLPGANKNNLGDDFWNDVNDILLETKEDGYLRDDGFFWMFKKIDEFKQDNYELAIASATKMENYEVVSLLEENQKMVYCRTIFVS